MKNSSNLNVNIFNCKTCGKCCFGYGGAFLSINNIYEISQHLEIKQKEFILKFTQFSGKKIILSQKNNFFCVFWNKKKDCSIHAIKLNMCKMWPYLKSILININNWKILSKNCFGINIELAKQEVENQILDNVEKNFKIYI